jgi:hypothetical protein
MDHQPGPRTAGKVTTDQQPTDEAGHAKDHRRAPEPAAITWTRARLQEQIQHSGAALASIGRAADRQTHDAERPSLADMEAEP